MDINKNDLMNVSLEGRKRYCFLVYLKLIFFPTIIYALVVLSYLKILDFPVEIHSVVLIGLIYLVSLLFARHNGDFGYCKFGQSMEEFRPKLKEYIVKNLMSIGNETKSNAPFDGFIEEFAKDVRNDNYASVGAGIFPTMGILGTFISIAISMPDFSSQTADALEHEISLLLSGVGTAFYVSIYGIFLSLWWIFFEKRGVSRFERDVNNLKIATKEFFWTKEEIEQAYLRENLSHFEKIGHMFETITAKKFLAELQEGIEEKFKLFDEMLKLEGQSVKMGAEHLKESMEILAKSQEEQYNLGHIHSKILENLEVYNENLQQMRVEISHEEQLQKDSKEKFASQMLDIVAALNVNASVYKEEQEKLFQELKEWKENSINEVTQFLKTDKNDYSKSFINKEMDEDESEKISKAEIEKLKASLKEIDSETAQIIQKFDSLK